MHRLLRHPAWLVAAIGMIVCLIGDRVRPGPIGPRFHDEFSYLLAGETFASGRLANPSHPLWQHFETFQELSTPTYASKYPPAQGLLLALGIRVGWPIGAVYLSAAVAAALVAWALVPRFGRRWALAGGLIAALHPVAQNWAAGFWGGSVAMAAGALLYGAVERWRKQPQVRWAALASVGVAVLVNARPFEGLLFAIVAFGLTLLAAPTSVPNRVARRSAIVVGIAAVLLLGGTGLYNRAVTGHAARFPYLEYEAQYAVTPPLIVSERPTTRPYRHPSIADYYLNWEKPEYERLRSIGLLRTLGEKAGKALAAWSPGVREWYGERFGIVDLIRPLTLLPLLLLPLLAWKQPDRRLIGRDAGTLLVTVVAAGMALWFFPHYLAPAVVTLMALHVAALRILWPRAKWLVIVVALAHAVDAAVVPVALSRGDFADWNPLRSSLLTELEAGNDRWLVIVDSDPSAPHHIEWVYNGPDLLEGKVLFARSLGDNAELIAFARRQGRRIGTIRLHDGEVDWRERFDD